MRALKYEIQEYFLQEPENLGNNTMSILLIFLSHRHTTYDVLLSEGRVYGEKMPALPVYCRCVAI